MNIKIVTIDRLKEFLNKFSKVATSGNYSDLSGTPTKVSQFTNDAGYAKTTDIPTITTYTAGEGIKIENGVISVLRNKIGNPICTGYTLYGDYFLSDNVITNKNWNEACAMTESVLVIQYYNYGIETKTATAKTLSKAELETLTAAQRKIDKWYWTSAPSDGNYAWYVDSGGDFDDYDIDSSDGGGGARLGFKNPFI